MRLVSITLNHFATNVRIGHTICRIIHTQLELDREETCQRDINLTFGDQAPLYTLQQFLIEITAFQVCSAQHGISHRLGVVAVCLVVFGKVADGPTVGCNITVELPLVTQDILQQFVMTATGGSLIAVVGTHDTMHLGFRDQFPESRQVGIPQVVGRHTGIVGMAVSLRTTVNRIVLGTCHRFQVIGIRTLQATYNGRTHLGCQIGILTIGLLSTSPSWIAEDVDVRCPIGQAAVDLTRLATLQVFVKERTSLRRGDVAHLLQSLRIERSRHTDGLRKDCYLLFRTSYPMQRLVPPVIGRNTQPGHSGCLMFHQLNLLLQRQAGDNVLDTNFQRQTGIPKREISGLRCQATERTDRQEQGVFQFSVHNIYNVCINE